MTTDDGVVRLDADTMLPLIGPRSLEPLMERIGNARYVLLGEASRHRRVLRLARTADSEADRESGFDFVAVEGTGRTVGNCTAVVGEPQAWIP